MYIGISRWKGAQWLNSVFISAFMLLHLIIAGYPIIHWDSFRYLDGAILLSPSSRAPTLLCYLIRPLIILMGSYGFVLFQILLLTYVLVSALEFFKQNLLVGIISIIISAAAYFTISVMMDIYTAVGLLALFLILERNKDIFLYMIAALCYIAHYENFFLFPICVVIYVIVSGINKFKSVLLPILLIFIVPLLGVMLTNVMLGKESRFLLFSKFKYSPTAVRIMMDSPEITRAYIAKYPDSFFARNRDLYELAKADRDPFSFFLWVRKRGFIRDKDCPWESKTFLEFAFKNYSTTLLKNSIKNTYRFLILPPLHRELQDKQKIDKTIKKSVPWQLKYAVNSLQYRGKLPRLEFSLLHNIYLYIIYPFILGFVLLSLMNKKLRDSMYYRLAIFSLIIILVNAFIMSNFVNTISRYALRIMLIPCFVVSSFVATYFKERVLNKENYNI